MRSLLHRVVLGHWPNWQPRMDPAHPDVTWTECRLCGLRKKP